MDGQVLAYFAKYDTALTGQLSYKEFIERLAESDFVDVDRSCVAHARCIGPHRSQ
jgi:hypothetical protein